MNRFKSILHKEIDIFPREKFAIWYLSFEGFAILFIANLALRQSASQESLFAACFYVAVLVGGILVIQYQLGLYLIAPNATKSERQQLIVRGQIHRDRIFFKVAITISYLFLILYAVDDVRLALKLPPLWVPKKAANLPLAAQITNWMIPAFFFLLLAMLAKARGIILVLSRETAALKSAMPVEQEVPLTSN